MSVKKANSQKKAIAKKMDELEKKFIEAPNDLVRVQVLNTMESFIEAELIEWSEISSHSENVEAEKVSDFTVMVEKQFKNLNDVLALIVENRLSFIPNAKLIFEARKRSHLDTPPTKHVSFE